MDKPFAAYKGELPYIFVCYAHEDSDAVYPEISWLHDQGVKIWYDEGISPGLEWTEALASAIQGSSKILFFVTPHSVTSEHCRRELNFAQEENHDVVAVHLGDTEVPPGLRLSLNNRQAILRHELSNDHYRQELMQVAQTAVADPAEPVPQLNAALPSRRRAGLAIAVVAAVTVVVGSVWWLNNRSEDVSAPVATTVLDSVETNTSEVLHNSIAVLPFENLSSDPENAYFAAGIHEETLNQLAKIGALSVIARTSVLGYGGSGKSIPVIASELNVQTVMEGSVRYAGDRVRITAQLIGAGTGVHLWSEVYDRELKDIFAIQSDIAMNITTAMKVQFSVAEQEAIAKRPTDNLEAYAHYIKAMAALTSELRLSPVHTELDAAISLDPDFALALATKAYLHGVSIELSIAQDITKENVQANAELAEQYANRALAIDADQGLAFVALSFVDAHAHRWERRFDNAATAYRLNPNSQLVVFEYGRALIEKGRTNEAILMFERAMSVDPRNPLIPWFAAEPVAHVQRWNYAKAWSQKVIDMIPQSRLGYLQLAQFAAFTGDRETASEMAERAESLAEKETQTSNVGDFDTITLIILMDVYQRLGRTDDVARLNERVARLSQTKPLHDGSRFWLNVALRNQNEAVRYLEAMIESNFPSGQLRVVYHFPGYRGFDPIRSHPDFDDLVRRAGLPLDAPD